MSVFPFAMLGLAAFAALAALVGVASDPERVKNEEARRAGNR